jgi:MFS family permease
MAVVEERTVGPAGTDVHWGAVIAGAIAAAALAFVLLAFGTGLGLAVSSASPTWRDASFALWFLSGIFFIFVALVSFGFGGYVAGRMRSRLTTVAASDEAEFRDGMHGLLAWALAIVIGAVLALGAVHAAAPAAVPGSGAAGPSTSVAGEDTIAYELDQLFRSERPLPADDVNYARAEAARILLTSSSHSGVSQEDREYLTMLVATRAHVSPEEADARVSKAIPRAHDALKRARSAGVMMAFLTAVAMLLGAAVSWFAAQEGGRERELGASPSWRTWSSRPVRT